ncbi:MAG TPA: hypothetical protein VIG05_01165, partial [Candidatus Nitrosotenuis sp.]
LGFGQRMILVRLSNKDAFENHKKRDWEHIATAMQTNQVSCYPFLLLSYASVGYVLPAPVGKRT